MPEDIEQLARFVPKYIQERIGKDKSVPTNCTADIQDALVLFADISGFTPLSIQLAELGPEGAEELDRILNEYYGRLVQIVAEKGGDIVAFAGDAAICVWPIPPQTPQSDAGTLQAAACALQIQDELNDYAVGNEVRLFVRMSVSSGSVAFTNIGGVNQQWHPLVVGQALQHLGPISDLAERGTIVVDARSLSHFPPQSLEGTTLPEGHLLLQGLKSAPSRPDEVSAPRSTRITLDDSTRSALRSFIPRVVLSHIDAGYSQWLADLRNLTVVFVRLLNLERPDGEPYELCQLSMIRMQKVMEAFEGDVLHVVQDDKGMIAVLCFGLPPNIHEDDACLAIRAALTIQSSLKELGVGTDIGISTGRIFSGVRGGLERCEYSITGHVVNLAARLMSKAEGGVLCDLPTRQQARELISFEPVKPLQLKGIPSLVPAFRPEIESRARATSSHKIVGRSQELALAKTWLDQIENHAEGPRVFAVQGEAGIGKSLLLDALVRDAHSRDLEVIEVECDVVERATPYFIWSKLLLELLHIDEQGDPESLRTQVLQALEFDPALQQRASILNPFLGCDFPEPPLIEQLSSEARASATLELLISLLVGLSRDRVLCVAVDDAQWLDSASWNILSAIPSRAGNVALMLAARPMGEAEIASSTQLLQSPHTQRVELDNLDREATEYFARELIQAERLSETLTSFLVERSQGNPFFVQELVFFLRESDLLRFQDGMATLELSTASDPTQVPTSMRALITSRVDRLAPSQQVTIKTASIVGRSFAKQTLLAVYKFQSDQEDIDNHLRQILELRLIQVESIDPEVSYLFQHLTVQQVIYDQIPQRNRRVIHRAIASWYEESHANDPSFYALLAYHWGQAQDCSKEIEYLAKSGNEASRRFANHEVVASLKLALQRVEQLDEQERPSATETGHWRRQIGEAEFHLGELPEARRQLEQANTDFGHSLQSGGGLSQKFGILKSAGRQILHRLFPSLMVSNRVVTEEEDAAGGLHEAALVFQRLSQIHYFQVDIALGLGRAMRALNLAERAGKSPLLAQAHSGMCLVSGMLRLHPIASVYAKLSRRVAEQIEHLPTLSYVLMATSVYRLGIGAWETVERDAQKSIELARKLADQRLLGEAVTAQAMLHCLRSDHVAGQACYEELGKLAQASENTVHIGWSHSGIGESLYRRGALTQALDSFEAALAQLHGSDHTTEEVRLLGFCAAAHWRLGNHAQAIEIAREALPVTQKAYATVSTLEGIAGMTEVLLGAFLQSPSQQAREQAQAACDCLKAYSGLYPIGKSRWLCLRAELEQQQGKSRRAQRLWQKSIRWAQRHQLPYDEAYARWSQTRFGDISAQRGETLALALKTFRSLKCSYETADCESLEREFK